MDINEAKQEVSTLRGSVNSLKSRYARNVQLKAATCMECRSIANCQQRIQRLRRVFPSISASWEDTFVAG